MRKALALVVDLVEQRGEVALGLRRGLGGLARRSGFGRRLAVAVVKGLLNSLLLSYLGGAGSGDLALAGLSGLAGDARALALDLGCEALERRRRDLALLGLSLGLLGSLGLATRALSFTRFAFLLDCLAAGLLLFGLALRLAGLFLGELLRLFVFELAGALLDFRLKVVADLIHMGLLQDACVALGGDLHLRKAIKQLLARHIEFFSQFMYSHARHIVSSSIRRCPQGRCEAEMQCARGLSRSMKF